MLLLFINKIHGHDKRESFILCPQRRFKGLLQTDVVPYKFTNFHKKEKFSPSSAKTIDFYLTYDLNTKSTLVKLCFTLCDLQNLNVIFKIYWLTLAIPFKFTATELASGY